MYEPFYGMHERPFSLTPDPSFLFMSRKHKFAFSMLEYALTGQAGFTVITGAIGSGKTTLIRHLLARADRHLNYGVISNTHESFGSVIQWILAAFGQSVEARDQAERYQAFMRYLIGQFGEGKQTVLIVDEAQNLSVESLEELRLLSNINADKDQLLQMILVGQPELLAKLRRPELVQFAQRISVNYHLSPLSFGETKGYIGHRLHVAGGDRRLFDEMAIRAVFYFSNGVPRIINAICDMALVYGFAEERREIGVDTILSVVLDKQKGGLLPLSNLNPDLDRAATITSINDLISALPPEDLVVIPSTERPAAAQQPLEDDALLLDDTIDDEDRNGHSLHPLPAARHAQAASNAMRMSMGDAIMPIMGDQSRRQARPQKVHWLLRFL